MSHPDPLYDLSDACRLCGASPMTANCNNANCEGSMDFYEYAYTEEDIEAGAVHEYECIIKAEEEEPEPEKEKEEE